MGGGRDEDNQLVINNGEEKGGVVVALVVFSKKGELWHHKNETKCVTNSKAASFGSSGLTPLTAPVRC